jgi:hypothetical protein
MRLILILAVIALGADALLHNGAYTQAAWRELSTQAERLLQRAETVARDVGHRG